MKAAAGCLVVLGALAAILAVAVLLCKLGS